MTSTLDRAVEVIEAQAHPERDGGPFTFAAECPKCGLVDLHGLRAPNLDQPRRLEDWERRMSFMPLWGDPRDSFGKSYRFDRWDERPFESVRTCIDEDCGYEWGHR